MKDGEPHSPPDIQIDGLTKRYGALAAIDNLSLSLHPGTLFCLLGRNGAGKTTTIQTMMGLRSPTSGVVRIRGTAVTATDVHRVRRSVGYLPEEPVLYPHLTGREFLEFIGTLYEVDHLQPRAQAALDRLELTSHADAPIWTYSRGMRKKLAFLGATLHEPSILILDEPTEAMDAVGAREVKRIMTEYRDRGGLVLFTTHVMEIAERLADRVAILRAGYLVYEGTLPELRARSGERSREPLEDIFIRLTDPDHPASRRAQRPPPLPGGV